MILNDQFLRQPRRGFGRDARIVALDQHDFAAGDRVAVLLHIRCEGRVGHLPEDDVVAARVRQHDADLDRSWLCATAGTDAATSTTASNANRER